VLGLDKIRSLLGDRKLTVVSEATGVHRNTLAGIRDGWNQNPTHKVMKALSDYFAGQGLGGVE